MLKSRHFYGQREKININYIELKSPTKSNWIQVPFKSQLNSKRLSVSFIYLVERARRGGWGDVRSLARQAKKSLAVEVQKGQGSRFDIPAGIF